MVVATSLIVLFALTTLADIVTAYLLIKKFGQDWFIRHDTSGWLVRRVGFWPKELIQLLLSTGYSIYILAAYIGTRNYLVLVPLAILTALLLTLGVIVSILALSGRWVPKEKPPKWLLANYMPTLGLAKTKKREDKAMYQNFNPTQERRFSFVMDAIADLMSITILFAVLGIFIAPDKVNEILVLITKSAANSYFSIIMLSGLIVIPLSRYGKLSLLPFLIAQNGAYPAVLRLERLCFVQCLEPTWAFVIEFVILSALWLALIYDRSQVPEGMEVLKTEEVQISPLGTDLAVVSKKPKVGRDKN